MRSLRRAAAVLMLLLLIVPVGMACTLPELDMTPAEKQCCRRMAHDCAAMAGKSSHSCCRTEVRDNTYISSHSWILDQTGHAIALVAPTLSVGGHLEPGNQVALAVAHAPPETSSSTTVLRI